MFIKVIKYPPPEDTAYLPSENIIECDAIDVNHSSDKNMVIVIRKNYKATSELAVDRSKTSVYLMNDMGKTIESYSKLS